MRAFLIAWVLCNYRYVQVSVEKWVAGRETGQTLPLHHCLQAVGDALLETWQLATDQEHYTVLNSCIGCLNAEERPMATRSQQGKAEAVIHMRNFDCFASIESKHLDQNTS